MNGKILPWEEPPAPMTPLAFKCLVNDFARMKQRKYPIKLLLEKRFGHLVVKQIVIRNSRAYLSCKCDCGKRLVLTASRLISGGMNCCDARGRHHRRMQKEMEF